MYLKLDGIEGESTDSQHLQWIEILSYSMGVQNQGSIGGTDGTGRASFHDISITKQMDAASPNLVLFAAAGKHIENAVIEVAQATKDKHVFMRVKLRDVVITSFQM